MREGEDRSDAGFREVFRGGLAEVELAAGVLEEQGIEFQRRWEHAGGTSFAIRDTSILPGRTAVLLVPSLAMREAQEVLAGFFAEPEPEVLTEFSLEVAESRRRRAMLAKIIVALFLIPVALWMLDGIVGALRLLFR